MSVYLTTRAVNFGGNIVPAGAKVSLDSYDDDFIIRMLEKGSVVEVTESSEEEAPVAPVIPEPVTEPTPVVEAPVQPQVMSGNPTPEQIDQELKAAGV